MVGGSIINMLKETSTIAAVSATWDYVYLLWQFLFPLLLLTAFRESSPWSVWVSIYSKPKGSGDVSQKWAPYIYASVMSVMIFRIEEFCGSRSQFGVGNYTIPTKPISLFLALGFPAPSMIMKTGLRVFLKDASYNPISEWISSHFSIQFVLFVLDGATLYSLCLNAVFEIERREHQNLLIDNGRNLQRKQEKFTDISKITHISSVSSSFEEKSRDSKQRATQTCNQPLSNGLNEVKDRVAAQNAIVPRNEQEILTENVSSDRKIAHSANYSGRTTTYRFKQCARLPPRRGSKNTVTSRNLSAPDKQINNLFKSHQSANQNTTSTSQLKMSPTRNTVLPVP